MALKPCRECGEEVSTKAKACPHCGTPHPTKGSLSKPMGCGSGCLTMIGLALVLGFFVALFSDSEPDSGVTSTAAANCLSVPEPLARQIASGLTVAGGGGIGRTAAVRSGAHRQAYFVAGEILADGLDDAFGLWATNDLDDPGMLFSVDGLANEFSEWGDGRATDAAFSITDPGASDAVRCARR